MAWTLGRAKPVAVRSVEGLDLNRAHFDKATGTLLRERNGATPMRGIRGDPRTKSLSIHLASEWVQVRAVKRFNMVNYDKPVLVFKLLRK